MKKFLLMTLAAIAMLGATSCSSDGPLTESSAKSALKDSEMFAKNTFVKKFDTGYYEVTSDETLAELKTLERAGVITLQVDEITEYTKKRVYGGFWTGYYTETVEKKHNFVSVELTEEGKKYEVEKEDWVPSYLEKYAKKMKDFEEALPPYMQDGAGTEASQQEIEVEAPVEEAAVVEEAVVEEAAYPDSVAAEEYVEPSPAPVPQTSSNRNAAYEAAVEKMHTDTHYMLMGKVKLEDIILVECTEEMFKNGEGKCSFIYVVKDKTPFGFVYAPHLRQDAYNSGNATFKYTNNRGWIVND